jgi:tetratricopeptide (TPR) repeat protein
MSDFIKDIAAVCRKNFYNFYGLFSGILACFLSTVLFIKEFFVSEKETVLGFATANVTLTLLVILLPIAGWILFWFWKIRIPCGAKDKIVLVIAITAESEDQNIRMRNDFVNGVKDLINRENIGSALEVVELNDHHSLWVADQLKKYTLNKSGKKEVKSFRKIVEKTNGNFFIFSDIKERKSNNIDKYVLSLNGIISHLDNQNKNISNNIAEGFKKLWHNSITFDKVLEIEGFQFTTESIFVAVRYSIGIAVLAYGDITNTQLSYKLFDGLHRDPFFTKFKTLPQNLLEMRSKFGELKALTGWIIANLFLQNGNLVEAEKTLKDSIATLNTYNAQITLSILEFRKNNFRLALKIASEAEKISNGDGVWRYNRAFLYMRLGRFKDGIRIYKQILKNSFLGEEIILVQIYNFNENDFLKNNPNEIWSYFIIAYLKHKKGNESIAAIEYFEKFLKNPNAAKYPLLVEEAKACIKEIDDKKYFPSDSSLV